jgi:hypothetical protein
MPTSMVLDICYVIRMCILPFHAVAATVTTGQWALVGSQLGFS